MIGTPFQQEILKKLSERSPVYIVGGALRDAHLGMPSKDVDAVTVLPLKDVMDTLTDWGYTPHLIGAHQQTVSVFRESERIDIASYSGDIRRDALRRDFTLNAIYQDVRTGEIIDPLAGIQDLQERRLKACGHALDRFQEDPLRILRLVRFAVYYGFEVDATTWQAALACIPQLQGVAVERITEELGRILILEEIDRALGLLDDLGYWEAYLPELARLKGLEQNRYHTKDAWEHTRHVVRNTPSRVLLRLAALFHDLGKWETASRECYAWGTIRRVGTGYELDGFKLIGKNIERRKNDFVEVHGGRLDNYPDTIVVKHIRSSQPTKNRFEWVPEGKRHFLQHEMESARLVKEILPRFCWPMVLPGGSKGERELIFLVGHHMIGTLTFMSELRGEVERTKVRNKARRFAWEIGWDGHDFAAYRVENLLDLWRADFFGGKQRAEGDAERFDWIQGEIRNACAFLMERTKGLIWDLFDVFARDKGLEGERYGRFKDQIRRQVMLETKNALTDREFLEREYHYFSKPRLVTSFTRR